MKYLKFAAVAFVFVALLAVYIRPASAQAPSQYSAEYNITNLYTTESCLVYFFDGLDAATQYTWLLRTLDENGGGEHALGNKQFIGGTSTTEQWCGPDFERANGTLYSGPAMVQDTWGQVQGIHYLLPGCVDTLTVCFLVNPQDWHVQGSAVSLDDERVGIGDNIYIDVDLNDEDYFHPIDAPERVSVQQGEHIFLHYRQIDPSTRLIRIYNKNSSTVLYEIEVQDLIDYNTDLRNTVAITPFFVDSSFVVLNTSGIKPKWVNTTQELVSFEAAGSGDNPHTMSFDLGAYDYELTASGGAWISDGESTLLVTRATGGNLSREWAIQGPTAVHATGTMGVELFSLTEGVWNSGYQNHELEDSLIGVIDSADYSYEFSRLDTFTAFSVQQAASVEFAIIPNVDNLTLATFFQRRFTVTHEYDIGVSTEIAVEERFENVLRGFGFDTTLGRGLAMLILMGAGMLALSHFGARGFVPFSLMFLVVGGGWLAIGLGDLLVTTLYGVGSLILIFLMLRNSNVGSRGERGLSE